MKKALVLAACAAVALGLGACKHTLSAKEHDAAELAGFKFTSQLHGVFVGCTNTDDTTSGYVSCTARLPGGGGIIETKRLEVTEILCPYSTKTAGATCKVKR